METNAPRSITEPLISQATGKKVGCVQHDCAGREALDKSLAEEIWLCETQAAAEVLAGNTVKETWWKGRLNGLRTVLAMRSNADVTGLAATCCKHWR